MLINRAAIPFPKAAGANMRLMDLRVCADKFTVLINQDAVRGTIMKINASLAWALLLACASLPALGQSDPAQKGADALHRASDQQLTLQFEERTRWEEQYGVKFGKSVNQQDMLSRLRIGLQYRPSSWLTLSAMGQDARAPFYGKKEPNSVRDTMDLRESWIAIAPKGTGLNFSFGRRVMNYGEKRLIGSSLWGNTARTFDSGRIEYASKRMTLNGLMLSPVIVQTDAFDTPELGNRIWGTYDIFPGVWHNLSIDAYALRHSENKIGGWTGKGTLGTNSFGARFYGPLPGRFAYSLEGIGQDGHSGKKDQRAYAWFAGIARPVTLGNMPLNLSLEYNEASGSRAGSDHSATYDQLAPSSHDKFGHMDLFGWCNLKTFKTLETLNVRKYAAFNLLYTNESLFSASDALYNSSGAQLALSAKGTAGKHVGQELDSFITLTRGNHTFYAGFGHFFKGDFIEKTTPGINPRYFYLAQQYVIK
jgi:hypothetical protein